jgi:hypothetical protein
MLPHVVSTPPVLTPLCTLCIASSQVTVGTAYRLVSAAGWCGGHFKAYVFDPQLDCWRSCDDMSAAKVGSWQVVLQKCSAGLTRLTTLFYQKVDTVADVSSSSRSSNSSEVCGPCTPTASFTLGPCSC